MLDICELLDTRHKVQHTGTIGTIGILRIIAHLKERYTDQRLVDWRSIDWVLSGPNGKIAKQIANAIFKFSGVRIDDTDRRMIGTIAAYFSSTGTIEFDLTSDFSWSSGDYGDHGSCFWWHGGSYRGALRDSDGYALRSYDASGWGHYGTGRSWILPVCNDRCVVYGDFNDLGDLHEFVIFNRYGSDHDIQCMAFALQSVLGAAHCVPCEVQHNEMHINGGAHYLITDRPAHRLYMDHYTPAALNYDRSNYPEVRFDMREYSTTGYCNGCQCEIDRDELIHVENAPDNLDHFCDECFAANWIVCDHCNEVCSEDDYHSDESGVYCDWCWHNEIAKCDRCGDHSDPDDLIDGVRGYDLVCQSCFEDCTECAQCGDLVYVDDQYTLDTPDGDRVLCEDCTDHYEKCTVCDLHVYEDKLHTVGDHEVCVSCMENGSLCTGCDTWVDNTQIAQYYTLGAPGSSTLTLCTSCGVANPDLAHVITRDLAYHTAQIALYTHCTLCGAGCLYGTLDCGLCEVCATRHRVPFVQHPAHTARIAYGAQVWRSYMDTPTPAPVHPDRVPLALLTAPITLSDAPIIRWQRIVGYECDTCDRCYLNRMKWHLDWDNRFYSTPAQPDPDLCSRCCHTPNASYMVHEVQIGT